MASEQAEILERFRILIQTQGKNRQVLSGIISDVTKNLKVFQITELLQMPEVKELEQSSQDYQLLQLFAYGNYQTWAQNKNSYPQLSDQQLKKLRYLTIIDLCSENKILNYELVKLQIEIDQDDEIDEILIQCIYSDLIQGKINQEERVFKVNSCISRDIQDKDVHLIKQKLEKIYLRNKIVVDKLSENINFVNDQKRIDLQRKQRFQDELNSVKQSKSGKNQGYAKQF